jgi:branched-chain amino acid transport system substrate-binding protein
LIIIVVAASVGYAISSVDNMAMDDMAMDDTAMQQDAMALPDIVNVGVLLPATGDLSSHGKDNGLAAELALEDFNSYLENKDATWRMKLTFEDTQTDPIIALEKLQSLNSKGIKLILGTETSAELKNIKSYADSNSMLLISPSSTSPKLAITDNIFRLIPDDTQQSLVIAKSLSYHDKKVVIPVYRGDVWGDGLFEATKNVFESSGGIVDQGIRYNPEITVFSTETSLLSDTLTKYQEDYTDDEIAILLIGFSEVVHFFNSANSYDNLKQVQWYGSDASSNDRTITSDKIASEFASDVSFVSTQFSASKNEKYQHVHDYLVTELGAAPSNYAYSSYDSLFLMGLAIEKTETLDANILSDVLPEVGETYNGALGNIRLNEYGDLAISNYEIFTVEDNQWILYGFYDSATQDITLY